VGVFFSRTLYTSKLSKISANQNEIKTSVQSSLAIGRIAAVQHRRHTAIKWKHMGKSRRHLSSKVPLLVGEFGPSSNLWCPRHGSGLDPSLDWLWLDCVWWENLCLVTVVGSHNFFPFIRCDLLPNYFVHLFDFILISRYFTQFASI